MKELTIENLLEVLLINSDANNIKRILKLLIINNNVSCKNIINHIYNSKIELPLYYKAYLRDMIYEIEEIKIRKENE